MTLEKDDPMRPLLAHARYAFECAERARIFYGWPNYECLLVADIARALGR